MTLMKTYKKFISLLAAMCVIASSILVPPAKAEGGIENLPLSLVPLGIPQELASIKEAFLPNTKTENIPLIHIQSVHAHAETQKKIFALLKFLDEKYGVRALFIEGAGEKLNPDYFKFFDQNQLNVEVAQKLVEKGELTGAELFLIESQKKIPAYGIEDPDLYRDNLESFQIVMSRQNETNVFTKGLDGELDRLETHLLTPHTRSLLRTNESFEAGQMELLSYAFELERRTKQILGVDLRNFESQKYWPQMIRLLRLQEAESGLDPERIQTDRQKLIADLKEIGVNPVLVHAFENLSFSPYQTGMVYDPGFNKNDLPRYLAEYLVVSTVDKGFSFDHYPYFTHYLEAAILQSELDAERLFGEMERLFQNLIQTVAAQPEELKLVGLAQRGGLFERLFDLELTPKDYVKIQQAETIDRPLVRYLIDMQSLHDKTNLGPSQIIPANIQAIEYLYQQAMRFYQLAKKREDVMVEKITKDTDSPSRHGEVTVLITGGFHADGLARAFRKKGISYTILSPHITEKAKSDDYVSSLLGEKKTSFDVNYLEPAIKEISNAVRMRMTTRDQNVRPKIIVQEIKSVLQAIIETAKDKRMAASQIIRAINQSNYASDRRFVLILSRTGEKTILWDNLENKPLRNSFKAPIVLPVGTVTVETPILDARSAPMSQKEMLADFELPGMTNESSSAVPDTSRSQTTFPSRQGPQIWPLKQHPFQPLLSFESMDSGNVAKPSTLANTAPKQISSLYRSGSSVNNRLTTAAPTMTGTSPSSILPNSNLLSVVNIDSPFAANRIKEYSEKVNKFLINKEIEYSRRAEVRLPDGQERNKKIAEIKPIRRKDGQKIESESDIERFVEKPLQEAVRIFYQKNIPTFYTSANREDLERSRFSKEGRYAAIAFAPGTLNEKNLAILKKLPEQILSKTGVRIRIDEDADKVIQISIPITPESTVREVSDTAVEIANRFESQTPSRSEARSDLPDKVKQLIDSHLILESDAVTPEQRLSSFFTQFALLTQNLDVTEKQNFLRNQVPELIRQAFRKLPRSVRDVLYEWQRGDQTVKGLKDKDYFLQKISGLSLSEFNVTHLEFVFHFAEIFYKEAARIHEGRTKRAVIITSILMLSFFFSAIIIKHIVVEGFILTGIEAIDGRIQSTKVATILERLDLDNWVIRQKAVKEFKEIREKLRQPHIERIETALIQRLLNRRESDSGKIGDALGEIDNPQTIEKLSQALRDPKGHDINVRYMITLALGNFYKNSEEATDTLIAALKDQDRGIQFGAVLSLGKLKHPKAIPFLIQTVKNHVVMEAVSALGGYGKTATPEAIEFLIQVAEKEPDREYQFHAIQALGTIGDSRAVDPLMGILSKDDINNRREVIISLEKIGHPKAIPALELMLRKAEAEGRFHREVDLIKNAIEAIRKKSARAEARKEDAYSVEHMANSRGEETKGHPPFAISHLPIPRAEVRAEKTLSEVGVLVGIAQSQSKQRSQISEPRQISGRTSHASSFFIKGQSATITPSTKKLTVADRKNNLSQALGIFPSTPPTTAANKNPWNNVKQVFDNASSLFSVQNIFTAGLFSFHHTLVPFNRETVSSNSLKVNYNIIKNNVPRAEVRSAQKETKQINPDIELLQLTASFATQFRLKVWDWPWNFRRDLREKQTEVLARQGRLLVDEIMTRPSDFSRTGEIFDRLRNVIKSRTPAEESPEVTNDTEADIEKLLKSLSHSLGFEKSQEERIVSLTLTYFKEKASEESKRWGALIAIAHNMLFGEANLGQNFKIEGDTLYLQWLQVARLEAAYPKEVLERIVLRRRDGKYFRYSQLRGYLDSEESKEFEYGWELPYVPTKLAKVPRIEKDLKKVAQAFQNYSNEDGVAITYYDGLTEIHRIGGWFQGGKQNPDGSLTLAIGDWDTSRVSSITLQSPFQFGNHLIEIQWSRGKSFTGRNVLEEELKTRRLVAAWKASIDQAAAAGENYFDPINRLVLPPETTISTVYSPKTQIFRVIQQGAEKLELLMEYDFINNEFSDVKPLPEFIRVDRETGKPLVPLELKTRHGFYFIKTPGKPAESIFAIDLSDNPTEAKLLRVDGGRTPELLYMPAYNELQAGLFIVKQLDSWRLFILTLEDAATNTWQVSVPFKQPVVISHMVDLKFGKGKDLYVTQQKSGEAAVKMRIFSDINYQRLQIQVMPTRSEMRNADFTFDLAELKQKNEELEVVLPAFPDPFALVIQPVSDNDIDFNVYGLSIGGLKLSTPFRINAGESIAVGLLKGKYVSDIVEDEQYDPDMQIGHIIKNNGKEQIEIFHKEAALGATLVRQVPFKIRAEARKEDAYGIERMANSRGEETKGHPPFAISHLPIPRAEMRTQPIPEPLEGGDETPEELRRLLDQSLIKLRKDLMEALRHYNETRQRVSPEIVETLFREAGETKSLIADLRNSVQDDPEKKARLLQGLDYAVEQLDHRLQDLKIAGGFEDNQGPRAEARTDEAGEVIKSYELGPNARVQSLSPDGVRWKHLWKIDAEDGGQFLLKEPWYRNKKEFVDWEASLLENIKQKGGFVSGIVKNRTGENATIVGDRLYVLYEFIEGEEENWGMVEGERLESAAKTLASIHNVTKALALPGRPYSENELPPFIPIVNSEVKFKRLEEIHHELTERGPPYTRVEQFYLDHFEELSKHIQKIREPQIQALIQKVPKVIVHGDYHQANVRFKDSQISGVFDFEYAHPDARIYDLSNGFIIRYQPDGSSLVFDKIEKFLLAYQKNLAEPLTEEEFSLLPEAFRLWYLEGFLLILEKYPQSPDQEQLLKVLQEQIANLRLLDMQDWAGLKQAILSTPRAEMRGEEAYSVEHRADSRWRIANGEKRRASELSAISHPPSAISHKPSALSHLPIPRAEVREDGTQAASEPPRLKPSDIQTLLTKGLEQRNRKDLARLIDLRLEGLPQVILSQLDGEPYGSEAVKNRLIHAVGDYLEEEFGTRVAQEFKDGLTQTFVETVQEGLANGRAEVRLPANVGKPSKNLGTGRSEVRAKQDAVLSKEQMYEYFMKEGAEKFFKQVMIALRTYPLHSLNEPKIRDKTIRWQDEQGQPGALVELRNVDRLITIGDLHGAYENLEAILREVKIEAVLRKDKNAHLVVLGDAIHVYRKELLDNPQAYADSFITLLQILRLKRRFPLQVHYLPGNHDYSHLSKKEGGVSVSRLASKQNVFFESKLFGQGRRFSEEALEGLKSFVRDSPVALKIHSKGDQTRILAAHAGPVQDIQGWKDFVNLFSPRVRDLSWLPESPNRQDLERRDRNPLFQLLWSRDYSEETVKKYTEKTGTDLILGGHTTATSDSANEFGFHLLPIKGKANLGWQNHFLILDATLHPSYLDLKLPVENIRQISSLTPQLIRENLLDSKGAFAVKVAALQLLTAKRSETAAQGTKGIYLLTPKTPGNLEGKMAVDNPLGRLGLEEEPAMQSVFQFIRDHKDEPLRITYAVPVRYSLAEDDRDLLGIDHWYHSQINLPGEEEIESKLKKLFPVQELLHDLNRKAAVIKAGWPQTGGKPMRLRIFVIQKQGEPIELRIDPVLDMNLASRLGSVAKLAGEYKSAFNKRGLEAPTEETLKRWVKGGRYEKILETLRVIDSGRAAISFDQAESGSDQQALFNDQHIVNRDSSAMFNSHTGTRVRSEARTDGGSSLNEILTKLREMAGNDVLMKDVADRRTAGLAYEAQTVLNQLLFQAFAEKEIRPDDPLQKAQRGDVLIARIAHIPDENVSPAKEETVVTLPEKTEGPPELLTFLVFGPNPNNPSQTLLLSARGEVWDIKNEALTSPAFYKIIPTAHRLPSIPPQTEAPGMVEASSGGIEAFYREVDTKYFKAIRELFFKQTPSPAVLVPASGSDVSSILLLTNAAKAVLVDLLPFEGPPAAVSEEKIKEYFEMKKAMTWQYGPILRETAGGLRFFVEEELKRMGAAELKIVPDAQDPAVSHVEFKWAYPGEEARVREFIFIGTKNADEVSEEDLKKWAGWLPESKFDAVVLKAGESTVQKPEIGIKNPGAFVARALPFLRPAGSVISDIPLNLPRESAQPVTRPELDTIEKEGAQFGYGKDFSKEIPDIKQGAYLYQAPAHPLSEARSQVWSLTEPLARFDRNYKDLIDFFTTLEPRTELIEKLLRLKGELTLEDARQLYFQNVQGGKYEKENPVDVLTDNKSFADIANNVPLPSEYIKMFQAQSKPLMPAMKELIETLAGRIFALHLLKEQDRTSLENLFREPPQVPPTPPDTEAGRSEMRIFPKTEVLTLSLMEKAAKDRPYSNPKIDPKTVVQAILEIAKQMRWVFSPDDEEILPALIEFAKQSEKPETESIQFNSEITRIFTLLAKGTNQPGVHAATLDYVPSTSELRGLMVPLVENKKARVSIFITPEAVKNQQDRDELAKRMDEMTKLVPDGRANLVYAPDWMSLRKEVLKAAHEAHKQYFPEGEVKFQTFLERYFVLSLPENLSDKIVEFGEDFGKSLRSVTYSIPEAKRAAYLVIMSGASTKLAQDILSLSQKQDLFEINGSRFKIKSSAFALVEAIWKVFEAAKQMAIAA